MATVPARNVTGGPAAHLPSRIVDTIRARSHRWWLWSRASPRCAAAYIRNSFGERHYRILSESDVRATRTVDTVFIFGSGYSLTTITPEEWRFIERHNTIGFSEFPRQSFVRADYHVIAELRHPEDYASRIRANPLYASTVFIVQGGWPADRGNNLIGRRLLPDGARIFRYQRIARGRDYPPSRSFSKGLVHAYNSLFDVVNFAYLTGWKTIVVAGVDLYDKRYFWLPADQTRDQPLGVKPETAFPAGDRIVRLMALWRDVLRSEGVELRIYNPRSRLAEVLPLFERPAEA